MNLFKLTTVTSDKSLIIKWLDQVGKELFLKELVRSGGSEAEFSVEEILVAHSN